MKIDTWAGKSQFEYTGCVAIGTKITFGKAKTIISITRQQYDSLRSTFIGQVVKVGTSRDDPQYGSIGEWLKTNVTQTAIASYVAPILVRECYAVREGKSEIRIVR